MQRNESKQALKLLKEARTYLSQRKIAEILGTSERTIRRWVTGECSPPLYVTAALEKLIKQSETAPLNPLNNNTFTFIDLFAGIGGIRLGFEAHGGKCVFTSEWNKYSKETYMKNFPPREGHIFVGDITTVNEKEIPDHDILLAGFPCQPFSLAGVSKKNSLGRLHGFECKTQGTLFFDIARIIAEKKPKAFLLENVKNLMSHDKGNTFRVIRETLENELKYEIHTKVIDGKHFVPQHRERIIIVGFKDETDFTWEDLDLPPKGTKTLKTILHPQNGTEKSEEPYTLGEIGLVNPKYTLSKKLWDYLQAYAEKHKNAGNGFGYGLVTENATARTLSARYYKDGAEILVSQGDDKCPRRLTPRECARLMGFPPDFKIPVSDNQAYKQFGNSVVVPVIFEVARIMLPHVLKNKTNPNIKKKVIKPKASSDAIRRTMQSNRGKNTKPELLLRKALFKHGLKGYRIHYKKLPGKPDICFTKYKIAIFINGCFWHRCPICKPNIPKHNSEFWEDKFNQTILRDKKINKQLTTLGWKVLVIWECEIKKNIDHQVEKIRNTI